jgi:pimeloyl-ACP methyl ester carboxylesterase
MTPPVVAYQPRHAARSAFHRVRGLNYHVLEWGPTASEASGAPLVMLHGWMDVAASFQFVVDALAGIEGTPRRIIAPDWRGFGHTDTPAADCYWFPDYLGDLDTLLDLLCPGEPVDLLGHSMGGNVVMSYAGIRPQRIRRLINLEGFGMPRIQPESAPQRLAKWLDELKTPQELRPYADIDGVVRRLMKNNPLLPEDKARWLAPHWSEAVAAADGSVQFRILGDAAHKRVNPSLYRVEEILATWQLITAPLLWVQAEQTDIAKWWGSRFTVEEFHQRLAVVPSVQREMLTQAGHMLHHDQPEALAALLARFLA